MYTTPKKNYLVVWTEPCYGNSYKEMNLSEFEDAPDREWDDDLPMIQQMEIGDCLSANTHPLFGIKHLYIIRFK